MAEISLDGPMNGSINTRNIEASILGDPQVKIKTKSFGIPSGDRPMGALEMPFLYTIQEWRNDEGDIILCNVPAAIKGVLELLDLKHYLRIAENEKAALSVCGAGA